MSTALLIAVKDLRQRARDKSLLILAFIAPLSLGFIFGVLLGGLEPSDDQITFSYGVVDLDGGELGAGFSAMLDDIEASGLVEITRYDDIDTARRAVGDTDVAAAFVLSPGLSEAFSTGTASQIQVIGGFDSPIATNVGASIARGFATRSSTSGLAGITAVMTGAISPGQAATVASEVAAGPPLAHVEMIEQDTGRLGFSTRMMAGMAIFFAFFVSGTAVTGILTEREEGTLPRLLASPTSRAAILLGKAGATIVVGIVALIALMAASTILMGADWGPPIGVLPLIVTGVLAATGIMSLVGGLAKNAEQAGNLQAIVAVSMAMLGGAFGLAPPDEGSLWAWAASLTPVHWFLTGLHDLAAGGVSDVLPATAAMLAMALVTGGLAATFAGKVLRP